jgi:hypothetical protein
MVCLDISAKKIINFNGKTPMGANRTPIHTPICMQSRTGRRSLNDKKNVETQIGVFRVEQAGALLFPSIKVGTILTQFQCKIIFLSGGILSLSPATAAQKEVWGQRGQGL